MTPFYSIWGTTYHQNKNNIADRYYYCTYNEVYVPKIKH